jgi:hypothetical protein
MQLQAKLGSPINILAILISLSWGLQQVGAYPGEAHFLGAPGDPSRPCAMQQQYQRLLKRTVTVLYITSFQRL